MSDLRDKIADILMGGALQYDMTGEGPSAQDAADAILDALEPAPLVWVENPDRGEGGYLATTAFGTYHATDDGWSMHRRMTWFSANSMDHAKELSWDVYRAAWRKAAGLDQ